VAQLVARGVWDAEAESSSLSTPTRISRFLKFSEAAQPKHMTIMMVMSETLSLANVKSKFSEMVDRVEHTHDRIIVTRNGRPAAVLISPDELASLEDTLELLSDPEAMAQLAESRLAYGAGDYLTSDQLRSRYLKK
jgi:antitoxin YefM